MLTKQDKGNALSTIQFILGVSAMHSAKSFITKTLKCKARKVNVAICCYSYVPLSDESVAIFDSFMMFCLFIKISAS